MAHHSIAPDKDTPKDAPDEGRVTTEEHAMKDRLRTGISYNEWRSDAVSDPDADKCLPPLENQAVSLTVHLTVLYTDP
jgi:hypothetical protein